MQDTTKHYINGQWVISIDGREMPVENPSTEKKDCHDHFGWRR